MLDLPTYPTSTNYIIFFCKDKKGATIELVEDVDYMLEEITAMASTKAGWAATAGKLAENVVEPWAVREMNLKNVLIIGILHNKSYDFLLKDQQDNAVITVGLVEDLLVGVILGTGYKEAGWADTANKLADYVNAVITVGFVEDLPAYVILGTRDNEAGWGKTAGKLAELVVEPVSEMNLKSGLK